MEKRTMLALFVTMILLVLFQYFYAPKKAAVTAENTTETVQVEEKAEEAPKETKTRPVNNNARDAEKLMIKNQSYAGLGVETYEDDFYIIKIDERGGRIVSWTEKEYGTVLLGEDSFTLLFDGGDDSDLPYEYSVTDSGFELVYDDHEYKVVKSFLFDRENGYLSTFTVDGNVAVNSTLITKEYPEKAAQRTYERPLYYDGKLKYVKLKDGEIEEHRSYKWAGFATKYHLAVFLADQEPLDTVFSEKGEQGIFMTLDMKDRTAVDFFYGPKRVSLLAKVDSALGDSIQFGGIIKPISLLFLAVLNYIYGLVGNYGIAIIILTILVKLIFFPLTHKSYISMAKMQKIQPEIQKIQKKYKEKPEEMNKKVMELYNQHKVNPMGGCLPLLLQFPVLWALFRVFNNAIELKGQKFFLWISDLAMPDTLFRMPFSLPCLGYNFNVLPILMLVSMIWMQKSNPSQASVQGANKFMMQVFMPLFMLVIFYGMPSGLVLYFLLSNVISILQQNYTRNHLKNQEA